MTATTVTVKFVPSHVTLHQVSLHYPVTLARRLFSSVPRREFALHNVTCQFGGAGEIVLLQGASSSGKSALLKVMAGHESSTHGHVEIAATAATPIMLVDKPPFDNQHSVQELLQQEAHKLIRGSSSLSLSSSFLQHDTALASQTIAAIITHFTKWLMLQDDATLTSKTPAQCSPSENYRIRLAVACLQSSLPGMTIHYHDKNDNHNDNNNNNNANHRGIVVSLPAPILLLDEWMDFETRDNSRKVEQALLQLVSETGAIVICATHKPHLWKGIQIVSTFTTSNIHNNHGNAHATTNTNKTIITKSQMTMCRGEILTLIRQQCQYQYQQ